MTSITDEDLLKYMPVIMKVIRTLKARKDFEDDLVGVGIEEIYRIKGKLDSVDDPERYLFRTLYREFIRVMKGFNDYWPRVTKKHSQMEFEERDYDYDDYDQNFSDENVCSYHINQGDLHGEVEHALLSKDLNRVMNWALEETTPLQKKFIFLRYTKGLTYREIAEKIGGVHHTTIKKFEQRIFEKIRNSHNFLREYL